MLQRLRSSFQLTIIIVCGLCAVVAILPFAVYRFISQQWLEGTIDVLIVLAIIACNLHAWFTGDTRRAGQLLLVVNVAGCAVMASIVGMMGALWAYPVVVMNFFLAGRRLALFASLAIVGVVVAQSDTFLSFGERLTFVATASLVSLYAFIYSARAASQQRQLEALASVDPLTGAGNRRLLEHDLEQAVASSRRSRVRCALALLDLDHFKQVNDLYGHEAGDRVLVDLVRILRGTVRKADRLYRFGGEEFVLLMPATDLRGLAATLRSVHASVSDQLKGPGGPIRVSIGAAVLAAGEDSAAWLARADAALYRAKRSGRDQIVVDAPDADADADADADLTIERRRNASELSGD